MVGDVDGIVAVLAVLVYSVLCSNSADEVSLSTFTAPDNVSGRALSFRDFCCSVDAA